MTTHKRYLKNNVQTREYCAYHSARNRCRNKNLKSYSRYGGKGIEFRFEDFDQFMDEVGMRPSNEHSLDRIDNTGHYEVGNVKWSTPLEQAENRRSNVILELNGRKQLQKQWAKELGISDKTIHRRLQLGWSIEEALTKPIKK